MLLSKEDVERPERAGFSREDFTVIGEEGLTRLRNVGEWCYFYNPAEKKCQVYEDRPLGCLLYPVIYSIDEGVTADKLRPIRHTISKHELKMKRRAWVRREDIVLVSPWDFQLEKRGDIIWRYKRNQAE